MSALLPLEHSPQQATSELLDVSVTECGQFRSCRRRWYYDTIENLDRKGSPTWHFPFGTIVHTILERHYLHGLGDDPEETIFNMLEDWVNEMIERYDPQGEEYEELLELSDLAEDMLLWYLKYEKTATVPLGRVLAVEGRWLDDALRYPGNGPSGYPIDARVHIGENGRFMVPIVDPRSKRPLVRHDKSGNPFIPCLTARIDMLLERATPKRGLWIGDHKTSTSAPNDRGLDFDDQITGYCYVVWRWLGQIPRGVLFNYLVKQVPKEPRMTQSGLSGARDQLTTPDQYRAALKEHGLMSNGRITSQRHADCLAALLARGWDPFFKRFEVTRNAKQLRNFERRLFQMYQDMADALASVSHEKLYPNPSAFQCPRCPVREICQAHEDGSDVFSIIEGMFVPGEDRKAI